MKKKEPEHIEVRGIRYGRISDPDTGESLGAYVVEPYK